MALFGMCLSKMIIITLTVWNHLFLFACRLQGSLVNAQDATNDFGVSLICSSVFRNIFGSFWHLLLWQEKSHDPIRRHNCYTRNFWLLFENWHARWEQSARQQMHSHPGFSSADVSSKGNSHKSCTDYMFCVIWEPHIHQPVRGHMITAYYPWKIDSNKLTSMYYSKVHCSSSLQKSVLLVKTCCV